MLKFLFKILHLAHRAIYLFTNIFSRSGIDRFLSSQIRVLNNNTNDNQKILNIGSGGFVNQSIKTLKCKNIINIDIDPDRNPDLVVDVCSMDLFEDNSFDAVFIVEVLEHVSSPTAAIKEIHRVLRKGGVLILTTPFIFEMHDCPHDYFRYTRYGLELLLNDFSSTTIAARNKYLDAIVVLCMRLFVSNHLTDKLISIALITIIILLYPIIWVTNRLIKSEAATSGYLVQCTK